MKTKLIKPKNQILKRYVQYFLFFYKNETNCINYNTFPNSNLCLAIYKENNIVYNNGSNQNNCLVMPGKNGFTSRLYGFHKMPFNVDISSCLDQICIIFYPSALSAFTMESYSDLMASDNVFNILKTKDNCLLEQLFDESDFNKRTDILENLLLSNLKYAIPEKLKEAMQILAGQANNITSVDLLAQKLQISKPSLFRLFKNSLGQNPKSYLKTVRFRNTLNEILSKQNNLTDIAYTNQFYDQAHFIHDFKLFSGYSPKQLSEKISVQQSDLAWIYNKK